MRIIFLLLVAPFAFLLMIPIGAAVIGIGLGVFGVIVGLIGAAFGIVVALFAGVFGGLLSFGILKFLGVLFLVIFIGYLISKRPQSKAVK